MPIFKDHQTFRYTKTSVAFLWALFLFLFIALAALLFKFYTRGITSPSTDFYFSLSGIFAFSIVFGRAALRSTSWKTTFSPRHIEWSEIMKKYIINRENIETADYVMKGRKLKASFYFVIKLKSGRQFTSPPLTQDKALEILQYTQNWLLADRSAR